MEKYIFVKGKKVLYFDSQTNGETVLLIHGWASSYHNWDTVLKNFSRNFHTIAVNLPGCGGSDEMEVRHTISNYAVFLSDFIQELKLNRFCICAESLGAEIALQYSTNNAAQLDKLCLVSMPLRPPKYYKIACLGMDILSKAPFGTSFTNFLRTNSFVLYLYGRLLLVGKKASSRQFISHQRTKSKLSSSKVFLQSGADSLLFDTYPLLKRTSYPTLLIYGTNDRLVNMTLLKKLPTNVKYTTMATMHKPYLQNPEHFAKLVSKFLNSKH